ncbi:MAG: tubulin-like doman-containing protein [Pirellulales bacterium]
MSTGTQACEIVLPGYTLTERIGSGGYAEVWLAEAPGGIEKAVKIVYGYYDDEFASQELKALERIKGVRHPFLLSLERFEILNGRLAILTELADMSLDQRLRQCRAEGLTGIPRDELLRYMADAAEALDFLSQRHNLLHLDIKPENLLVLGDHIKVADFGLVKELASRTQNSLVSGMTPSYASPEMFDDEPTAHSDQYSLAIVYQEMLVGTLPFPGRTAAQLAKQHTQTEPQLMSVPAEDRPVVARALAKKPTDRFPSCRAFVDALLRRPEALPTAAPTAVPRSVPVAPRPVAPDPDDTKPPSACTTLRRSPGQAPDELDASVTRPVRRGAPASNSPPVEPTLPPHPVVPEETVDIAVPEIHAELRREQPTLYIAVGGVGIQLLCRLRALVAPSDDETEAHNECESIALDTDRDELRDACSNRWKSPLASNDTLHLPLRLPKNYENAREILGWVSRRWLYNIPRSLETRGYRPLGRVALVDHAQRVLGLIDEKLNRLAVSAVSIDAEEEPRDASIRVVLLTSTGGGTGTGMVIDVANAVRARAAARNIPVEIHGFLICTCFATNNSSPLVAANTFSLLTELTHATDFGNESTGETNTQTQSFESRDAPFDFVYCVAARPRTDKAKSVDSLDMVARYLALEQNSHARAVFRSCRLSPSPREMSRGRSLLLRKLGHASLADHKRKFIDDLAADLANAIQRYWLTKDTTSDWERLVRAANKSANAPQPTPAADGNPPSPLPVPPVNEAAPLALRGRFKEYLSLEFTSEVLRQIQRLLESRDDRGRPLILPRDAKLIADTARVAVGALLTRAAHDSRDTSQCFESAVLRPLIAAGSRRVLSRAIEAFDTNQPDRFLSPNGIDELIQSECLALLDESLEQPELAATIAALIDLDKATASTLACATTDLLQCGCDRRTLVFAPMNEPRCAAADKLRASRPLAAVVPAAVEDVIVVSEEAGISPQSLARGLERLFPGIADASRRLLTRGDVEWQSLL